MTSPVGDGFDNPVAVTFQAGSTVSITGTGLFIYNGTPTAGNLVMVLALDAGTDSYGNTWPPGITINTPGQDQPVIQIRPDLGAILVYPTP